LIQKNVQKPFWNAAWTLRMQIKFSPVLLQLGQTTEKTMEKRDLLRLAFWTATLLSLSGHRETMRIELYP